jgi:hypothetical protein
MTADSLQKQSEGPSGHPFQKGLKRLVEKLQI